MMEKEEPIYKFDGLKKKLESMGYVIGKAESYRPVKNVDVDINDLKNNMEFTDDGIFLIDSTDGSRQQIFLYKRDYHLELYGKPRFHICKCETIQEFINRGRFKSDYRRANTETVMVRDMDDGYIDKKVSALPLCQYCAKMIAGISSNINSVDFVELLKSANDAVADDAKQQDLEVDIFGYTKDWENISEKYRESRSFRCEKCGITINEPFDRQYMHVHHKNGNKSDNREANLQCLCIKCHSEVDEKHKYNFSKGANKVMLEDFKRKYLK